MLTLVFVLGCSLTAVGWLSGGERWFSLLLLALGLEIALTTMLTPRLGLLSATLLLPALLLVGIAIKRLLGVQLHSQF